MNYYFYINGVLSVSRGELNNKLEEVSIEEILLIDTYSFPNKSDNSGMFFGDGCINFIESIQNRIRNRMNNLNDLL